MILCNDGDAIIKCQSIIKTHNEALVIIKLSYFINKADFFILVASKFPEKLEPLQCKILFLLNISTFIPIEHNPSGYDRVVGFMLVSLCFVFNVLINCKFCIIYFTLRIIDHAE